MFSPRTHVTSHSQMVGFLATTSSWAPVSAVLHYRCRAVKEEILSTSVTDLTRVQAALDHHHVDNLMPASPRKVDS